MACDPVTFSLTSMLLGIAVQVVVFYIVIRISHLRGHHAGLMEANDLVAALMNEQQPATERGHGGDIEKTQQG